jgi:hypothetical protein
MHGHQQPIQPECDISLASYGKRYEDGTYRSHMVNSSQRDQMTISQAFREHVGMPALPRELSRHGEA